MQRSFRMCALAVMLFVAPVRQAMAEVVFSNFGPGLSYNSSSAYLVNSDQGIANPFMPSVTSTFASAIIAVGLDDSLPGSTANISLETDVGGLPGTILEQFSLTVDFTFGESILVATSVLNPTLNAGTTYWLVATSADDLGWSLSNSDIGNFAFSRSSDPDGPWLATPSARRVGAFEINGQTASSVPEPSSLALLGLGGIGLAVSACRRRRPQPDRHST